MEHTPHHSHHEHIKSANDDFFEGRKIDDILQPGVHRKILEAQKLTERLGKLSILADLTSRAVAIAAANDGDFNENPNMLRAA